MKCAKCGFESHVSEFMVEQEGLMRLPDETIKKYEEFIDRQNTATPTIKDFAKFLFRLLSGLGLMPYHVTQFRCPKCGSDPSET